MEPQFSVDWFTPNIPTWEQYLAPFKDRPNIHFLEIGSWEGRSACWLLQNILTHPSSSLTCIDLFDRSNSLEEKAAEAGLLPPLPTFDIVERQFEENVRAIGAETRVRKLKGSSHFLLRPLPLGFFDCIYIDGSHRATDVLRDAVLSWDLLKERGLLIFDDYHLQMFQDQRDNPRLAIDAFLSTFDDLYVVLHSGWQVIVRKECGHPRPLRFSTSPIQRTEEASDASWNTGGVRAMLGTTTR